jgi:hypothetical protein
VAHDSNDGAAPAAKVAVETPLTRSVSMTQHAVLYEPRGSRQLTEARTPHTATYKREWELYTVQVCFVFSSTFPIDDRLVKQSRFRPAFWRYQLESRTGYRLL